MNKKMICAMSVMMSSGLASAGEVWPESFAWPMEHIMISMDGGDLHAHVNTSADNRIEMQRFDGAVYSGAADVLTETYYSDQYGWVADGFLDPGAGNSIWIEQVSASSGLRVYEGGMRMMRPSHSYDAIFGTNGSNNAWQWSGMMTHNWYSANALGAYEASYRIFVADEFGNAVDGFGEASVTLHFVAVPAPGAIGVLAGAGLIATRRKRGSA